MEETEKRMIRESVEGMDKTQRALFYEQKKKSPELAAATSFIIPGLGQIWLGRIGKGIIIFLLCLLIIP